MTTQKSLRFAATLLSLLCGFLLSASLNAQIVFGPQQIISADIIGAHSVDAIDLDSDGDNNVLSALNTVISWHENDGTGIFTEPQTFNYVNGANSVYAIDLDGDGDNDVLSTSANDNKIAWHENDGSGNFGEQQVITMTANGASSIYAADLDNDGDVDVLSASVGDDKIAWYENNGNSVFIARPPISTNVNGARSVYAADLDNDGDMDVLSASYDDDKIAWYENLLITSINNPTTPNNSPPFTLSPNPAQDQTTLQFNQPTTKPYRLTLYDMAGHSMFQAETQATAYTLDLRNMTKGIYLLQVQSKEGLSTAKIVKQ